MRVNKQEKEYFCQYCHGKIKNMYSKYGEDAGGKYKFSCAITRGPSQEYILHNRCINPKIKEIDDYWAHKKEISAARNN